MSRRDGYGAAPGRTNGGPEEPEMLAALAAAEGRGLYADRDLDDGLVDEFELAAGAVFAALRPAGSSHLARRPDGLEARLEQLLLGHMGAPAIREVRVPAPLPDVPSPVAPPATGVHAPDRTPRPWGALLAGAVGWLAAAGLLAVLATRPDAPPGPEPVEPTMAERVAALTAEGAAVVPWATEGLHGDVVWSDAANEGYMRIDGLPPNDPTRSQYQLWIFRGADPAVEPHPVDGGVFDIPASGEVIVPIDAKLAVGHAGLFAVTVEDPGGVVVSGREQIVAVAVRS